MIRLEFDRAIIALQRLFEALQFTQCDAAVVVCFCMIRRELDRAIIAPQRLFEARQLLSVAPRLKYASA